VLARALAFTALVDAPPLRQFDASHASDRPREEEEATGRSDHACGPSTSSASRWRARTGRPAAEHRPTAAATPVGAVRRAVAITLGPARDRGFTLALALQAPIFGILSPSFEFNTMIPVEALNASVLVWLVVVGATWLGTWAFARRRELPIYRENRRSA
jgi:hypothetical protein